MIARVWSARATRERAPAYVDHLRTHVLPNLRGVDGYAGAKLLQRVDSGAVEIVVITWWHSLAAISGFAGADIEKAVVASEAATLLTQYDDRVQHFEVVVADDV